ncbi:MAG TPA: TlpA disulfide reductase family protein [Bryobacteraceae bacterium]|nr:TlpA disulfide reductase family protein [Bryobacteraceae bacterium]
MTRTLAAVVLAIAPAMAQSLAGLWDATVLVNGLEIPFRMEFTGAGPQVAGSFFNGDEKVTSTSGRFENGTLRLNFDHYGSTLQAIMADGTLKGDYIRPAGKYPFSAKPAAPPAASDAKVPKIDGMWEIQVHSPKGESAWRFIVRQTNADVSAAILRIDGDTGTLAGHYKDGKFVLSHFSGARPSLLEVTPQADGTLALLQNGKNKLVAYRPEVARAKGMAPPTEPTEQTHMKNPDEPLHFSFADLNGKMVSNDDPRFKGKVVIVSIMGSWCPNCHDEAPFLVELYRKYHQRGLEIVALSFEEGDQLQNPTRLRSFIQHYGIEYPVLIPGQPEQLQEKLSQAENLNSWPTTFFLGRDGRVRTIHAGFAGKASGPLYEEGKKEMRALVERLLDQT